MKRRTLLLGGLLTAAVASTASAQAGQLTVIYVGGWDCPNCTTWKNQYKSQWEASPEFKKVKWVMVDPHSLRQAYNSSNWPADLRPVLDKLPQKSGTPRFLVVKDGSIIANKDGVGGWLTIIDVVKKD